MENIYTDAAVIGGGASGLICACTAAKKLNGKGTVTLIEKNPRTGKKILVTGNGRCNLTNINSSEKNYLGSFKKSVSSVLSDISPKDLLDYFYTLGLVTTTDSEGRVYPLSKQASSVLDVLRNECKRQNVKELCDCEIDDIKINKNSFLLIGGEKRITAKKVVIATGGKTTDKLGCDGKMLKILKNLGHTVTPLSPALTYIKVDSSLPKSLKGIRASCSTKLISNGKNIMQTNGELQFSEKGLSGICMFDLSCLVNEKENQEISVNFIPDNSFSDNLNMLMYRISNQKAEPCENLFTGLFHKNLAHAVLKTSGISLTKTIGDLCSAQIKTLCKNITDMRFKVVGKGGFENAQVTLGGIVGEQINEHTMESKVVKNLYICGEAVDIAGFCGGYNLQFAFASGILAGRNI